MLRVASEAILPTIVEVSGSPVDITFDGTDALTNGHPVIATAEGSTVNINKDLNTVAKELDCNHLLIVYNSNISLYLS